LLGLVEVTLLVHGGPVATESRAGWGPAKIAQLAVLRAVVVVAMEHCPM